MINMNNESKNLAINIVSLRKQKNLSQEKLAELVGVTRQSIAKWESEESTPDILYCNILATVFDVSLDDLVRYNQKDEGLSVPPKGKHLFGIAILGERGQIVIPKKARDIMGLKCGDTLVVLGDSNPDTKGIALMQSKDFMRMANQTVDFMDKIFEKERDE